MTYNELQEKQDKLLTFIREEFGDKVYQKLGQSEFLYEFEDTCI